jgi:hypothetical protein
MGVPGAQAAVTSSDRKAAGSTPVIDFGSMQLNRKSIRISPQPNPDLEHPPLATPSAET